MRCVFAITLDAGRANTDANPPVVHLAGLAEVCTGRWSPCKWSLTICIMFVGKGLCRCNIFGWCMHPLAFLWGCT